MAEGFRPGQRWVSVSEPELGLGVVRSVSARSVVLWFHATRELREYSQTNAPVRRAAYRAGDTIADASGQERVITRVTEHDGLYRYICGAVELAETELAATLGFGSPIGRLFAGQFDATAVFDLRVSALQHQHRRRQSEVRGFLGGRIDLLPHQISIAAEVTSRLEPRVLLADEVGLGKTIEACLILHRLLLTGRAQRVLVLLPESLVHQWFVELWRRFNLWFHIFDEARCQAIEEATPEANPFLENQLVLCDIGLLLRKRSRIDQAVAAGWDLLVVDEAHHLEWTPDAPSDAYTCVETLGRRVPGLMLLTATPEQLGLASHFARLRLLDPDRFHDLNQFTREFDEYRVVAGLAQRLKDGSTLSPADVDLLASVLARPATDVSAALGDEASAAEARAGFIETLLDQHGTGRVMFRNTRKSVAGFPPRLPQLHSLDAGADPARRLRALTREWSVDIGDTPESAIQVNFADDPRIEWLVGLLKRVSPDKVLLICRTMRKAAAIETALKARTSIPFGVFHEGLTLVQRDRGAAWFADPTGARLLVSSEIGSEGRNFQFAHHLVLFDLPLNPGLLEQRIGRLDRVGQRQPIELHVPVVEGSPQEVLARWYHDGLNAFGEHLHGGEALFVQFEPDLRALSARASRGRADGPVAPAAFIEATREAARTVAARLEEGRDRLLEWNSFRPAVASRLITAIRGEDDDPALDDFLLSVLDLFMVQVEELAPRTFKLGSAGVLVDEFPGLPADGLTLTADRQRAVAHENLQFLTWDHPIATGALDLLLGSEQGTCSFARWIDEATTALYLEVVYMLECVAPPGLHVDRFLPPTPVHVVVDHRGRDAAGDLLQAALERDGTGGAHRLLERPDIRDRLLPGLIDRAAKFAARSVRTRIAEAGAAMRTRLGHEIDRLRDLQKVNRSVRDEEVQALVAQQAALDEHIAAARLRLDAVRLVHRGPRR